MPIAHPASPGPLRQGDILKDLSFYVTGEGGAVCEDDVPFCVVLSRDCNALRAETVVVAEVRQCAPEALKRILSGEMSLDEARRTMDALRDGDATPDTCYLGPLLDDEQRYAVKLDRIHTIDVPVGEKRKEWIEKHRVFQLDVDFIRHLQVRLFSSVAKQGFDDFTWWPRQDLEALVVIGKMNIANIEAAYRHAVLNAMKAGQDGTKEKKRREVNNTVDKRKAELEEARSRLADYEAELERRKSG